MEDSERTLVILLSMHREQNDKCMFGILICAMVERFHLGVLFGDLYVAVLDEFRSLL